MTDYKVMFQVSKSLFFECKIFTIDTLQQKMCVDRLTRKMPLN